MPCRQSCDISTGLLRLLSKGAIPACFTAPSIDNHLRVIDASVIYQLGYSGYPLGDLFLPALQRVQIILNLRYTSTMNQK